LKIIIFGSNGLVGSSLVRTLKQSNEDFTIIPSTRNDANLFSLKSTREFINKHRPNLIINAAAKVGGILANNVNRTEFILENLKINMNILESIIDHPHTHLINLGSSCIYPLNAKDPINEESLMTGVLESTNSPYAMAKLAAIEIGDAMNKQHGTNVLNLMPTNLYGPNDNFSYESSHVIPGLISRMHNAKITHSKQFNLWGTGKPLREFLFVDDLSDAIQFLINQNITNGLYNIGSGEEITIYNLVNKIKDIIGFDGEIVCDLSKPDGNPRKLLDNSRINSLGWKSSTSLDEGLMKTYKWFLTNFIQQDAPK